MATNDAVPTKITDRIASAIMDTIEREKRINRDDLVRTVEMTMLVDQAERAQKYRAHVAMIDAKAKAAQEAMERQVYPAVFIGLDMAAPAAPGEDKTVTWDAWDALLAERQAMKKRGA